MDREDAEEVDGHNVQAAAVCVVDYDEAFARTPAVRVRDPEAHEPGDDKETGDILVAIPMEELDSHLV